MKKAYIKSGFFDYVNRSKKLDKSLLDIPKELRKEFAEHKITYIQPCCPCPDEVPVRINTNGTIQLQHWDCETSDWTATQLAELSITDITADSGQIDDLESVSAIIEEISTESLNAIAPKTTITVEDPFLLGHGVTVAKNVTDSLTAIELSGGYITSTSAAAVTITMPTVATIVTQIGAVAGDRFQFLVDNHTGANTVTLDLTGSGISTGTSPITGGSTLTISTANLIGLFELFFTSGTTAVIRRIA